MNHVTRVMLVTAGVLPACYGIYLAGSAGIFVLERQSSGSYNPQWPITVERKDDRWTIAPPADDWHDILTQ